MVCDKDWNVPEELDGGYAATFARLRGLYRSRGLAWEDAADLAQEAIARSLLHLKRHGCNGEPVTPLVNRIATNLLIDHLRAGRGRVVSLDDERVAVSEPIVDQSEEIARRHITREVRAAVAALPSRHQRAIAMSLDGSTPAEIAAHLGIRRNAADALLFRARRGLAEHLRSVGATVHVVGALLVYRARSFARRATQFSTTESSGFFVSTAAMNMAAGAVAAVLALGLPASAAPVHQATRPEAAAVMASRTLRSPPAVGSQNALTASKPPTRRQRAVVAVSVGTSKDQSKNAHVKTWYQSDPNDPGITGPIIESAMNDACDAAPATCGGTP